MTDNVMNMYDSVNKYFQMRSLLFIALFVYSALGNIHAQSVQGYIEFEDNLDVETWNEKWIPLYDSPNGTIKGSIQLFVAMDWCFHKIGIGGQKPVYSSHISKLDHHQVFKCGKLFYYEKQNNYVRILHHSFTNELWIPLEYSLPENPSEKIKFILKNIFDRIPDSLYHNEVRGYSIYYSGLKGYTGHFLRSSPDVNGEVKLLLNEKNHKIDAYTGRTKGAWAEVNVFMVDNNLDDICNNYIYPYPERRIYKTGWLKMLDENNRLLEDLTWSLLC